LWQGGTGWRTGAIALKNWTPIAPRDNIQTHLYVDNSFYGTQYAISVVPQICFDAPNGVNALPLVDHEFAFLGAHDLVFLLCNVPLSFEQCRYK
jgi:hypothetical protein